MIFLKIGASSGLSAFSAIKERTKNFLKIDGMLAFPSSFARTASPLNLSQAIKRSRGTASVPLSSGCVIHQSIQEFITTSVEKTKTVSGFASSFLKKEDNSALNNSTFDVKRNEIVEMDKRGQFIPFCTRMVFLKYYTPSDKNSVHFWGQADREYYVDYMNKVLSDYIEPIVLLKEEEING